MQVQDLSHNRRISRLTQLNRELEQSRNPDQTFATLQRAFSEVDGFVAFILLSTTGLPTGHYRVLCTQLDNRSNGTGSQASAEPDVVLSKGILATIVAHRQPQLVQDVDWALDPYFRQTLAGYSSVMAIPLAGNHLRMTWAILLRRPPERFTESDLEEAVERAAMMSALLENQVLAIELTRANEQIDRDARHVGELQRSLLPASLPRIAGLEIVASYEPTGRAGGDLYDFFPLDDSQDARDGLSNRTPSRWCVCANCFHNCRPKSISFFLQPKDRAIVIPEDRPGHSDVHQSPAGQDLFGAI